MVLVPGKPDYRSIKMQTRCGNDIENEQGSDISTNELIYFKGLEKKFRNAYCRSKPNATYNCHGMTFASGRTWVFDGSVQMILQDDGYCKVDWKDVLPGDIIIYYEENGEITHSGVVACTPEVGNIKVPWVVSKWGKYGEVYHDIFDCPYKHTTRSYWRITR